MKCRNCTHCVLEWCLTKEKIIDPDLEQSCDSFFLKTNFSQLSSNVSLLAEKFVDATYRKSDFGKRPSWSDPYGNAVLNREEAMHDWMEWLESTAEE